jgi:hypothetical protein
MSGELFELELLGGATEQRFRRMRPEVEEMPWGTLDLSTATEEACIAARVAWTGAAYQEHRTARTTKPRCRGPHESPALHSLCKPGKK